MDENSVKGKENRELINYFHYFVMLSLINVYLDH